MTDTTRNGLARALDQTLVDMISLGLVAKQAHWNVVGPGFRSLHLLLDQLADLARDAGDRVAERAASLGHSPDGRPETVAANNPLPSLELGPLPDTDVVALFGDILETIRGRLFTTLDAIAADPVTQGIFLSVAEDLDKVAWMISAHRRADRELA